MEPLDALQARTLQWWISTILPLIPIGPESHRSDRPWHVLVVGHGLFIRTLVLALVDHERGLLSVEPGTQVGRCFNTAVTTIHLESPNQGTLVQYGDITHIHKQASNVVKGLDTPPQLSYYSCTSARRSTLTNEVNNSRPAQL